jgi:formylglycine-generating enzyme required for sulfatase activity
VADVEEERKPLLSPLLLAGAGVAVLVLIVAVGLGAFLLGRVGRGKVTPSPTSMALATEPKAAVEGAGTEATALAPTDTPTPSALPGMERVQPFEPEMILIPGGEFLMGSDPSVDKDAPDGEQPQHTLYLPDYYLATEPVTNAQYAAFVEATGYDRPEHWEGVKLPSGKEDHPVVYVSWHDAVAYCNWLAEVTGKPYRLPSEAEWEKGARGTDGRIYPWGDQWDAKRCNSREGGKGDTTPVRAYPEGASPYGVLEMAGNVWEWTRSIYKDYPYNPEDGRENLEAAGTRVLRGGAFYSSARSVRCARRRGCVPFNFFSGYLGFRVVLAPG